MSKLLFRLLPAVSLLFCLQHSSFADCVDSVRLEIRSVQCFGLRNGVIYVDSVYGGEKPFFYSLDGQSFSTNPTLDHLWPGAYTLYVRDASNCVKEWLVNVPESEELRVYLVADTDTIIAGEPFGLKAVVVPEGAAISSVEWRPPDLFQEQNTLAQNIRLYETTPIAVEVRTFDGCLARGQTTMVVEKTNLYFPNVIKPGSNQDAYFTLYAGEGVARIVAMQVFSRSGGLVYERHDFEPNDPIKGWNGRWKGKGVQPGVYPWIAIVEYLDGKQRQFQGSVTVVN